MSTVKAAATAIRTTEVSTLKSRSRRRGRSKLCSVCSHNRKIVSGMLV